MQVFLSELFVNGRAIWLIGRIILGDQRWRLLQDLFIISSLYSAVPCPFAALSLTNLWSFIALKCQQTQKNNNTVVSLSLFHLFHLFHLFQHHFPFFYFHPSTSLLGALANLFSSASPINRCVSVIKCFKSIPSHLPLPLPSQVLRRIFNIWSFLKTSHKDLWLLLPLGQIGDGSLNKFERNIREMFPVDGR